MGQNLLKPFQYVSPPPPIYASLSTNLRIFSAVGSILAVKPDGPTTKVESWPGMAAILKPMVPLKQPHQIGRPNLIDLIETDPQETLCL